MKKAMRGILSLALALTMLVTSLVIPFGAFAADTEKPSTILLLNRDFEDGTDVTNGFGATQFAGNTITVEKEDGNSYMHWVYDSTDTATKHGHFNIETTGYLPETGSLVLRMKVRSTDVSSTSRPVLIIRPYDYHHGASILKPDGTAYGYNSGGTTLLTFSRKFSGLSYKSSIKLIGSGNELANEFVEVAYVFTWTDKANVTIGAYYDGESSPTATSTLKSYGVDARPCYFRFQVNTGTNLSWDLDDLELYISETTDPAVALSAEHPSTNRGQLFNGNAGAYVPADQYLDNYYFKMNVDKALDKNGTTVYTLGEKPFTDDAGELWFPVSALEQVIGTVAASAPKYTVSGTPCINYRDISLAFPGYYGSYYSAGLVAISEKQNVFVEGATDESLIPIMQKFIFDHVDTSLNKVEAFSAASGQYLDHPYILADQDKFDELRAVYLDQNGTADPVLKGYILNRVNAANSVYTSYAITSGGSYSSLNSLKGLGPGQKDLYSMPYQDAQGYDIGGRHSQATTHANNIMSLAFGYQITRDMKYAMLAYDYAVAIGGWEHWGPGHFLNCADAAGPYSIAFDWLYDAWVTLGYDVAKIEEIIFTHGVIPGFYSRKFNTIPEGWMRYISGVLTKSGWGFSGTNNWNAVCSSGMVLASLAIVGKTTTSLSTYIDTNVNTTPFEQSQLVSALGDHTGFTTYQDYAEWLINECLYGMAMKGLNQYIPDGSYIESSGYWSYGTNNFFEMCAALTTATEYNTGTANDFGMLDAWGIDRTCYYALNTQSSDYNSFNYHDSGGGSVGAQDTSWFPYYGNFTGKTDLAEIRNIALASGKSGSATIQDVLFYKKVTEEIKMPPLQNWWEGINGYVMRDSWESGAIYAGIMGDTNNLGHGQIDSGSFVYHNGGTVWFCDTGTENYNCYGFWGGATRYRYYKMSAEGNNTLFINSRDAVPYGQALNGFGKIIENADNDHGAYAIIDNTSAYGGYANYAYRGMLFTNDRRTVVIQDEVEFMSPENAYWVGHTQQEVALSIDGTVAYMTDGKTVIRVTIVDKTNSGAKFEIEDCYTFHLAACEGMDELAQEYYEAGTHEDNYDRSQYKRLTIALEGVTEVKLAVVIEEVAVGELSSLGYEWQDITSWTEDTPTANGAATEIQAAYFDGDEEQGRIVTSLGNLAYNVIEMAGNPAYVIGAGASTIASRIGFLPVARYSEFGYLGDRKIACEVDLTTYSTFPEGARISLYGTGGEILGIPLSELGAVAPSRWERLTLVVDGESDSCLVFFGDTLVRTLEYTGKGVEEVSLSVTTDESAVTSGTVVLDNVSIRIFGADYTSLDTAVAEGDITKWQGRMPLKNSAGAAVATVYVHGAPSVEEGGDFDTPVVDVNGRTYAVSSTDNETYTAITAYSWADVSELLDSAFKVELHAANTYDPLTVNKPVTFDTNGFALRATSPKYSAFVSGETVEFRTGNVTVTWVTDSGSVSETYSCAESATYKGSLPTTIYERAVDGGYEYYVKNGWSRTKGGSVLTPDEMIVTSENCTFYVAEAECQSLFVTVKGASIVGYDNPDDLLTRATVGGFDRVSLLRDIVIDASSITQRWSGTVRMYLNGNSLTYRTSVTSDHMMMHSASVYIYGPGKLIGDTTIANLFLTTGGVTRVENATVEAPRAITDHRGGRIEFVNCEINITKAASAFGVRNRNNVHPESSRPTLIVEGCVVNIPNATASTAVFTVSCNSVFRITDTVINAPAAGHLFSLDNTIVGTDPNYSFVDGYKTMEVRIGNISYNTKELVKTTSNDPNGYKYPEIAERLGYVEGALIGSNNGTTVLYEGCVIARQPSSTAPYVVVKRTDAVNITWRVGSSSFTEYWVKGSVPTPDSPEVKALTVTSDATKAYSFPEIEATADATVTGVLVTRFEIKESLALYNGFTVNIYVELKDGVSFTDFKVDGKAVIATQYELDGKQYMKITLSYDDPITAAADHKLTVRFNDSTVGAVGVVRSADVSIINYISTVLAGDYSREEKSLVGNILKYVKSIYEYKGEILGSDYRGIVSLYDEYSEHITVSAIERQAVDMSAIRDYVTSAALYLDDAIAYRFFIADGFSGSVTLSYTAIDGSKVSKTFDSSSFIPATGADGGMVRYVELQMRPFELTSDITITVGGASAVYNLRAYYHAVAKEQGVTTNLINAIYAYAESAVNYKANEGK